jgi:hypothetical protein
LEAFFDHAPRGVRSGETLVTVRADLAARFAAVGVPPQSAHRSSLATHPFAAEWRRCREGFLLPAANVP